VRGIAPDLTGQRWPLRGAVQGPRPLVWPEVIGENLMEL